MSERAPEMAGPEWYESQDRRAKKERRERIATAVLASMASAAGARWDLHGPVPDGGFARRAVEWADALIVELDK